MFVDTDGIDDMRSVLLAVKKKYQKMDLAVVVETDDEKLANQLNSEWSDDCKDQQRPAETDQKQDLILNICTDEDASQCNQSKKKKKKKKWNSRLERLKAKKEKMKKSLNDSETSSNDSGIDMTDMMKNFEEQVASTSESTNTSEHYSVASCSKTSKRKRTTDDNNTVEESKRLCTGHPLKNLVLPPCKFDKSRIVAMDCEFVGVGPKNTSALGK